MTPLIYPILMMIVVAAVSYPIYHHVDRKYGRLALMGLTLCLWVVYLGVSYAYDMVTWRWFAWNIPFLLAMIGLMLFQKSRR